ncbi:MAG: barstar family protein [Thermocrispum agreste]|uniref:Barstar family protein n=1 Tax=Thermocrispum agreste TaxID=37925 RepID=A0ABD6FAP4_9PSEU
MSVVEEPAVRTHAEVASEAAARGAYVHTVSGAGLRDKLAVLDAIADAMEFPESFGRNLDALYDYLTDLSWLPAGEHVLIWVNSSTLGDNDPRAYLAIRSVLSDAQRALGPAGERADSRQLTVELVDS